MFRKSFLILLLFTMVFSVQLFAAIKPADIFADNMVLQREKAVPVWGTASKGEKVTVSFAGQEKGAVADEKGNWMVKLDPLETSSDPAQMIIKSDKQKDGVTLSNILVGEVWFCSGQSNMAFLTRTAKGFKEDQKAADLPLIRYCSSKAWLVCSSDTVGKFSAVAFYFAREIHKELNVPVGLIVRAVGGTPIEFWAPKEKLLELDFIKTLYEKCQDPAKKKEYTEYSAANKKYRKALKEWRKLKSQGKADDSSAPKLDLKRPKEYSEMSIFGTGRDLGCLYENKVVPVIPYAIRGFLWYQGESDSRVTELNYGYRKTLPVLIKHWRKVWGGEEKPFLFVQLPNYSSHKWPVMRESMLEVSKTVPNTGMAVTLDLGSKGNIHPVRKREVGERLALIARKKVYGKDIVAESPIFDTMSIDGSKAILSFINVGSGLVYKQGKESSFEVAGEDKKFLPADAKLEGNRIIVSCKDLASPVAVRYAWAADPEVTLYNKEGLPASPFRTDTWPVE